MKTSHTPGPWAIDTDKSSIIMSGQRTIINPSPDGASRAEEIANARLIAAAPDLLRIAQELAELTPFKAGYSLDHGLAMLEALQDKARAAIARATN